MSDAAKKTRVLLIDDDRDDYHLTREMFREMSADLYHLDWESDFDKALIAVEEGGHDAYLVDYRLGAKTGLDLLTAARELGCESPIILLTGHSQYEIDQAAAEAGAADYLEKENLSAIALERALRYSLLHKRYENELERKVKERTAALAAANDALRDADRRKDEFLATLAHELRNPLTPIRTSVEIMRLSLGNNTVIENSLRMLDRQVRHMVRLIDDLLDVSRITRGKLRLELESIDLAEIVDAAVEATEPFFAKAKVTLTVIIAPEPLPVRGDRVRLTQLLGNLLNNAAKYTEPGGTATVSAERAGDVCLLRVRDTGVGIPSEVIGSIFDLFTQVDHTLNRSQGGLGIGLGLVQSIAVMHGGRVTASSAGTGLGSEFVVELPKTTNI